MSDWQDRLIETMQARGLSGGELARRAGFTAQYINSLRSKERGARLPLDTALRLAHALGISVEWLTHGTGSRERLSDVYPVYRALEDVPSDRYPSRAEAVALLQGSVDAAVISALRASLPENPEADPGRQYWIGRARELLRDLRRIRADPELAAAQLEPHAGGSALLAADAPESGWQKSPLSSGAARSEPTSRRKKK